MSLSAQFVNRAAAKAAEEAARKLNIDPWTARKLAPIAVSMLLFGLKRNTATLAGGALLGWALDRYQEDLLRNDHRLAAADIRARGDVIISRTLGAHRERAEQVIGDLADLNRCDSVAFFAMTASAVVSALAKARKDLHLTGSQLQGVIKSEAAHVDDADPELVRRVRDWVFRPAWPSKIWASAKGAIENRRRQAPRREPMMVPAE